jgi:hypothetical protein
VIDLSEPGAAGNFFCHRETLDSRPQHLARERSIWNPLHGDKYSLAISPALSEQINFLVGGSSLVITWEIKKKPAVMRRHLYSRREKRGEVRIVKLLAVRETRTTCGTILQPLDIARPLFVIHEP